MDPKYFEEIYGEPPQFSDCNTLHSRTSDLAAFLEMAKWARKLADVEPLKAS
jgi:hypothetical protein